MNKKEAIEQLSNCPESLISKIQTKQPNGEIGMNRA